jgi:putative transposase
MLRPANLQGMPNCKRFHVASLPLHVVQRGNNKQSCFMTDEDRREYLQRLAAASSRYAVAIHAYVLMTNHVHLLLTPASPEGAGKLMQSVGGGYVRSFNARHARTGTLWDGRYFSSLVGADAYLWNCHRYIELNPVRAGLVQRPGAYRWSSYAKNAFGAIDPVVTPHAAYHSLAESPERACARYREMFDGELPDGTVAEIRERLTQQRAFGDEAFLHSVEPLCARSPRVLRPGRRWPAKCDPV